MNSQPKPHTTTGKRKRTKKGKNRPKKKKKGAEEEGGNEPDKDGFTKLTKAEQLELPFDLTDREKG